MTETSIDLTPETAEPVPPRVIARQLGVSSAAVGYWRRIGRIPERCIVRVGPSTYRYLRRETIEAIQGTHD